MNGRNIGPLSPISTGGESEGGWSGISKYQNQDSPYGQNNRGQLISPPVSSGSNGAMNGGGFFPRVPDDRQQTGPSPPASIARSSIVGSLYNGSTLYATSEAGGRGSKRDEHFEGILAEHYVVLRRYLAASLQDEKANPRPNKARDKLLRLSHVQFQELSTDVFDELLRRQAAGRKPPNAPPDSGPPPFLQPKDSFHPKRNQARQKLSTLPPPRFRDLATDVFYELERRFPKFAAGDILRTDSPASMRGPPRSMTGTPVGGPRLRRPSDASSMASYNRSDSRQGQRSMNGGPMGGGMMSGGLGIPGSPGMPPSDYGRPLAKTIQGNTIVPNKSTMVEDDDDLEDEDAFALEGATRNRDSKRSVGTAGNETDKRLIAEYQQQVAELKEKVDGLGDALRTKDQELQNILDDERSTINNKEQEWSDLRLNLESKVAEAQNLNEALQGELDRVRADQSNSERNLRDELAQLHATGAGGREGTGSEELERENQELRAELQEQLEITNDGRRQAQDFLMEMRVLTERSELSWQREEQLLQQVDKLEAEVKDWKNRYAKAKTQLRSMRTSSIGLSLQHDATKYARDSGFTDDSGLVKDVHVTKFQISIDELLRTAREETPERAVDFMKNVIVAVRRITQDIDVSNGGQVVPEQAKLKLRVSATANNLITAAKNFASAKGISPVSLLDAAASHLTAAVVELVRMVKIRPTPADELDEEDDVSVPAYAVSHKGGLQSQYGDENEKPAPPFLGFGNRGSNVSSMYSPVNSPRQSGAPRPRSSGQWAARRPNSKGVNGVNGMNVKPLASAFGIRTQDSDVEDLRIYLEDQTALLVQTIQSLVSCIRSNAPISLITTELTSIAAVVGKVVVATETAMSSTGNVELREQGEPIVAHLKDVKNRVERKRIEGEEISRDGDEAEWKSWTQTLPPVAFEVARETKELVQRVDSIDSARVSGADDFS